MLVPLASYGERTPALVETRSGHRAELCGRGHPKHMAALNRFGLPCTPKFWNRSKSQAKAFCRNPGHWGCQRVQRV